MSISKEQQVLPPNATCATCGKRFYSRGPWETRHLACHKAHTAEAAADAAEERRHAEVLRNFPSLGQTP